MENFKNFLEIEELSKLEEVAIQGGATKQKQQQQQRVGSDDTIGSGNDVEVGL